MEYEVEINTVPEIADSEYLDRLAEIVYELPGLVDPLLALNDDGSISATFCVAGADPLQAANEAVQAFVNACDAARPLRAPTDEEVARGLEQTAAALGTATVGSFGVTRVDDREKVYA